MALRPQVLRALELIPLEGRYRHIRVEPRMPNFAAWVEDVDLTQPLSADVKRELRQALWDFEVLFFKPQKVTSEQHIGLCEVFGPIASGAFWDAAGAKAELEVLAFDEQRPPFVDAWHTDLVFKKHPPAGSVIQITEIPPGGGNTCWVSTTKAYAALSPGLQAYFAGLQTENTWEQTGYREYLGEKGWDVLINAMRDYPPQHHPLVLTHPHSGRKSLYFNRETARRISSVDIRESKAMLEFLAGWVQRPEFMVHHAWEENGIAIWDNRTTQHYACADYWPHRRVNQRITFGGPLTAGEAQAAQQPAAVEAAAALA